jgi:DNA-binding IclR family transcriptional regulator
VKGVVVTKDQVDSRRAGVTARVLALLSGFDETHQRMTLTQLARHAGLPLSTAHRLLAELEAWDAVDRDEEGRYCVGRRLWQLGTLAPVQRELREVALPAMQDLYEATHENVQLAVLQSARALVVERIHGKSSVAVQSRAGRPLPVHTTGVGKVLIAHADTAVVEEVMAHLTAETRYSITEPGRFARELTAVRRNGFARTAEEMTMGTCSVAVPILGRGGEVVAALGLVTRTVRRDMTRFVPALLVASAGITRDLPAHADID